MPHPIRPILLVLPLLAGCALFRGESTLTGSIRLQPGVEQILTVHAGDGPVQARLTNRGPAPATIAFDVEADMPEMRQDLPADGGTLELDSDGGTSTLRLRSTGEATIEYAFRTRHGIHLEWSQR